MMFMRVIKYINVKYRAELTYLTVLFNRSNRAVTFRVADFVNALLAIFTRNDAAEFMLCNIEHNERLRVTKLNKHKL